MLEKKLAVKKSVVIGIKKKTKQKTKEQRQRLAVPQGPCVLLQDKDKRLGSAATGYTPRAVARARVQVMRPQWKFLNRCRASLWARRSWTHCRGLWETRAGVLS